MMDVSIPKMDGAESTRRIKAELPQVRGIALSMFDGQYVHKRMAFAGAETFVSKNSSSDDLLKAIFGESSPNPKGNS